MPRSKNPNPRQLMEGDGKNTTMDCGDRVDNEVCEADSPDAAPDVKNGPGDEDQFLPSRESALLNDEASPLSESMHAEREPSPELTSQNAGAGYSLDGKDTIRKRSDGLEEMSENFSMQMKPATSFDTLPSTSFFTRLSPTMTNWSELGDQSQTASRTADARKSKNGGSSVFFNPKVMTWMRNRFQIRPGGRISASDIIALYKSDTEHLEDPPPGLQNYQVGQLLRRVFPNITRCKVTVDGRRPWVYKYLNLVENPPADLFEERYTPLLDSEENGGLVENAVDHQQYRASDSPGDSFGESAMEGYDDLINDGSRDPNNDNCSNDRSQERSNAILLGLLSKKIKSEPLSPSVAGVNGALAVDGTVWTETCMPKKKRDSEVNEWLKRNYKFKSGYYVKSMDLLRKYNNGRVEMVKYLSQVGRVMKQVFPGVRHLRKSFKGGKREWVYLNLKPVDVDSDSEEGRKMVMPTMRRSTGWYDTSSVDVLPSSSQQDSQPWRQERTNISRGALPIVQRSSNMVFRPRTNVIRSMSHSAGNNKVISLRSSSQHDKSTSVGKMANSHESQLRPACEENGGHHRSQNKTRIVLYNERDRGRSMLQVGGVPDEIERDIFAPFVKLNRATRDFEQRRNLDNSDRPDRESNSRLNINVHRIAQNSNEVPGTSGVTLTDKVGRSYARTPLNANLVQSTAATNSIEVHAADEGDESDNGLDLSMKRLDVPDNNKPAVNKTVNGPDTDSLESPGGVNLSMPLDEEKNSLSPETSTRNKEACSSQTIHYRPSEQDVVLDNVKTTDQMESHSSVKVGEIITKSLKPHTSTATLSFKRQHVHANSNQDDTPITWQSLQTYSAQKYGWLRSSDICNILPQFNENGGRRSTRFVEWFIFTGQWLVNGQRALREIKIYEDWTVAIHALGRRVYPNDLGGITDLEKTPASLNKVFRVLAEAKLCMGFPAPSVSDLYIHGILVSKFEVWSSREEAGEDVRQRAVNCQILYSGTNACCNKCARIMKLHQQQRRGTSCWKRSSTEQLSNPQFRPKQQKM